MRHLPKTLVKALSLSLALLAGCSDSDSNDPVIPGTDPDDTAVFGSAIKGPLAGATVTAYVLDHQASDLKGRVIGTATTNSLAQIEGLEINSRRLGPFLLEFAGGNEVGSNISPAIPIMRTLLSTEQLRANTHIYATPLSTLTLELYRARRDSDGDGAVTTDENNAAMAKAISDIVRVFGRGALDDADFDFFASPPVLTTTGKQSLAVNYRYTSEVTASLMELLVNAIGATDANAVMAALADDWASDGVIDGSLDGEVIALFSGLGASPAEIATAIQSSLQTDVATLSLPGKPGTPIVEVLTTMTTETTLIGNDDVGNVDPASLIEPILGPLVPGEDTDGDGIVDAYDLYPTDPTNSDADGDGVPDADDACFGPGSVDDDGDEHCIGPHKRSDYDDSNSSVQFICDDLPELGDTAGASIADQNTAGCNVLSDADSWPDFLDIFPLNDGEWVDYDFDCGNEPFPLASDGNGCGDNSDPDIDNDGQLNAADAFDYDNQNWLDCDNDGIGEPATDMDISTCIPSQYQVTSHVINSLPLADFPNADKNGDSVGSRSDAIQTVAIYTLDPSALTLTATIYFDQTGVGGNPSIMIYAGQWVIDLDGETLVSSSVSCTNLATFGCGDLFQAPGVNWPADGNGAAALPANVTATYDAAAILSATGTTITVDVSMGDGIQTVMTWVYEPITP